MNLMCFEKSSSDRTVLQLPLLREGTKTEEGFMSHLLFAMAQTFTQSKEVSVVLVGVSEESVLHYKQIQGYTVPEQQKYSHFCLCLWIQFNTRQSKFLLT